jgi:hypothetical protein
VQDIWHYPRSALAQQYIDRIDSGLSHALVLFGPRRTGKTEFLLRDLGPHAQALGWRVAYASLWQTNASPLAVILHALTNAGKKASLLDRAQNFARAARPKLKLGGALPDSTLKAEAELDLSELSGPPPSDLLLLLDELIERFTPKRGRALLLIDEAQELATTLDNKPLVAALRTSLDKRREHLSVVFTGSSQDALRAMFSRRDAPFFHYGTLVTWPEFEDAFVDHMLVALQNVMRIKLDRAACIDAFHALDRSPFFFRKLIEMAAFDPAHDVKVALLQIRDRAAEELRYPETWRALTPLQQAVAIEIAAGEKQIYAAATLRRLGRRTKAPKMLTRAQALAAVRRLTRLGLTSQTPSGAFVIDDPNFAHWIKTRTGS